MRRFHPFWFIALLLVTVASSAQTEEYSIKGYVLRTSMDAVATNYLLAIGKTADPKSIEKWKHWCGKPNPAGVVVCGSTRPSQKETIAGYPVFEERFEFIDGQLYRYTIYFLEMIYPKVVEAVTSKYGPPTKSGAVPYQNGFGAQFPSSTSQWERLNSVIGMEQYSVSAIPGEVSRQVSDIQVTDLELLKERDKRQVPSHPDI